MKKIFDIIPPYFQKDVNLEKFYFKRKRNLVISCISFLILILLFFHFFYKVEIKIWPRLEEFQKNEELIICTDAIVLDLEEKILPAKIFEDEIILSEEFSASGKIQKKAEGTIRLYNSYATFPEMWLKNTRFLSSEGKLFLSKDEISVPSAKIEKGKSQRPHSQSKYRHAK